MTLEELRPERIVLREGGTHADRAFEAVAVLDVGGPADCRNGFEQALGGDDISVG